MPSYQYDNATLIYWLPGSQGLMLRSPGKRDQHPGPILGIFDKAETPVLWTPHEKS